MQGAMLVLCVFALSSCGRVSSVFGGDDTAQPPANTTVSATGTKDQAPVTVPPGAANRPPQPGQSGAPHTPDGMPALQPARGINLESVFAENIKDPVERVKRVENAVVELRRDFDSVLPAIVRLSAVEADMQALLGQLESLLRSEPPAASPVAYIPESAPQPLSISPAPAPSPAAAAAATPVPTSIPASTPASMPVPTPSAAPVAPAPAMAQPAAAAPAAAAIPGAVAVTALRLGEHKDKTRLVMDVTGASSYSYDLDNTEHLLVIDLPGTGWKGAMSQTLKSPLVDSYTVSAIDGGGSRVVIQLKRNAQVAYEAALKPDGGSGHRIVLDIRGQ